MADELIRLLPEQRRCERISEDRGGIVDDQMGRAGGGRGQRGVAWQLIIQHAADNTLLFPSIAQNKNYRKGTGITIWPLLRCQYWRGVEFPGDGQTGDGPGGTAGGSGPAWLSG
jgi:hypothetical protein